MALILEKGGDEGGGSAPGGGTDVDKDERVETKSNKASLNSGGIVLPGTAPGLAKMPGHKGKWTLLKLHDGIR